MSRSVGMLDPVWEDPTSYDYALDGPPYLPDSGGSMRIKNASLKEMSRKTAAGLDLPTFLGSLLQDYGSVHPMAPLGVLVSFLRALAMLHQAHHWQTQGDYGDHLLFERLYGMVDGQIDPVAEKAVGLGDANFVCPKIQAKHVASIMGLFHTADASYVGTSLQAELITLTVLEMVYKGLQADLSPGVDNMLQGIMDKHEENLYLLQQRVKGRTSSVSWKL